FGNRRKVIGILRFDDKCSHLIECSAIRAKQFRKVVPVKIEHAVTAAAIHQTVNGQLRIDGKNCTLQRDAISDFPFEPLCQCNSRESAGSILDEVVLLLFRLSMNSTVDIEEPVGVHGELSKKVCRILVNAAKPLARRC